MVRNDDHVSLAMAYFSLETLDEFIVRDYLERRLMLKQYPCSFWKA
jgi:hypothetical protein